MASANTPQEFFFTIGGFFGDSYQLNWHDDRLWYLKRTSDGHVERQPVDPTPEQWEDFWQELDRLNIWRWGEEYVDMSVRDGTSWAVEIRAEGRTLASSGRNAYPPNGRGPSLTPDFRRFLKALSRLLGGREIY